MPTHEKFHRFHVSLLEVSESCPTLFSRDFARGAYAGGMVIYAAIQLAVYMAYPVIQGIPCLLPNNAIVATKYFEKF